MGDSGRQEDYAGDMRVWEIKDGGEVWWEIAETAWDALRGFASLADPDEVEWSQEISIRAMGATETVRLRIDDERDIPAGVRDWPIDDDDDTGRSIEGRACEWALAHEPGHLAATCF